MYFEILLEKEYFTTFSARKVFSEDKGNGTFISKIIQLPVFCGKVGLQK